MTIAPYNLAGDKHTPAVSQETTLKIGILALQGAFLEHENIVRRLGGTPVEVRLPEHLEDLDGLIIPGGESTTIGKLANQFGLIEPLHRFIAADQAVWGTCAGLIFLAKDIGQTLSGGHKTPPRLAVMDITVNRNAFGRQVDSFEAELELTFDPRPFPAIFIRAPRIEAWGEGVQPLARLPDQTVVAARQNNLLATAFHPELTDDPRLHQYFLKMVTQSRAETNAQQ